MEPSKQNLPALRRQVLERDFSRMNDRQKEAVFATEGLSLIHILPFPDWLSP